MKKLVKSVLMLSIASLAVLSSCKKDDDNADVTDVKVEITATPSGNIVMGTPVTIKVVCTGNTDNKLKSISVKRTQGADEVVMVSKSLTGTSATEEFTDTPVTGSYTYTVAVTGEKGSPATKVLTITTVPPPGNIGKAPSVPLFGAGADEANPNFMQLSSPYAPFTKSDFASNKSNLDLAFYFGQANKATISSPSDNVMRGLYSGLDWTGTNTTQLYKTSLTAAQFDDIYATATTDAQITDMAANVTTWTETVTNLATGHVILYKTADGVVGLLKVVSVLGATPDGQIEVKIISQD
jgi:hypothetical protein